MTLSELRSDFSLLESWEDKYRYIIDMGNRLTPLEADEKNRNNKVSGCVSQVWLVKEEASNKLVFRGTSDASIVRGLIALLILLYSHKTPKQILEIDAAAIFAELGLREHITQQRSDGFSAMVMKIKKYAKMPPNSSS